VKKRVDITIGGTVHAVDIDADIKWIDVVEYIRNNEDAIDNLRERFPMKFPADSKNKKLLTELDDACDSDELNAIINFVREHRNEKIDAKLLNSRAKQEKIENVVDGVTRGIHLALEHLQKIKKSDVSKQE
jgi:hypothetical protein